MVKRRQLTDFSIYFYYKLRHEQIHPFAKNELAKDFKVFIECMIRQTDDILIYKNKDIQIKGSESLLSLTRVYENTYCLGLEKPQVWATRKGMVIFFYEDDQLAMFDKVYREIETYQTLTYKNK